MSISKKCIFLTVFVCFALSAINCSQGDKYDLIIRNGKIYNGVDTMPVFGDVAINDGKIVDVGVNLAFEGEREIDAGGLAVAPGFINMLSWSTSSLIQDGKSQSEIRQGVTLEVFGEGWSEGPLSDKMIAEVNDELEEGEDKVGWRTLGEYLEYLENRGVSTNVASFVGATTVRIHEVGYEDREPTEAELENMIVLVEEAMKEGALGVASALIYAPAFYSKTAELIELCKVAAKYDGMYISHLRSEGNKFIESLEELIEISMKADIPAEIYHFKAAGKDNWGKMDKAIKMVEDARARGLKITADMYNYTAGATGLDAAMPPWVQEGGYEKWAARLKDPATRKKVIKEMKTPTDDWENLMLAAGSPDNVLLSSFKNDDLKKYTGKTLSEVAKERGMSPEETAIDLVIEDGTRVGTVYFIMSDENIKKKIALPWMAFCSDSPSMAPEGNFLKSNPHPRAYGSFARLLGKYVRDEKVIPLGEAIRRLTSFPAMNLKLRNRGQLKKGYYADIVIFDPQKIEDKATFAKPHQYSIGVNHVFVNGVQVLKDGEHTGAKPGTVVRGPGWTGWNGTDK